MFLNGMKNHERFYRKDLLNGEKMQNKRIEKT